MSGTTQGQEKKDVPAQAGSEFTLSPPFVPNGALIMHHSGEIPLLCLDHRSNADLFQTSSLLPQNNGYSLTVG